MKKGLVGWLVSVVLLFSVSTIVLASNVDFEELQNRSVLRETLVSVMDGTPMTAIFCPVEKSIFVFDSENTLTAHRVDQDEDAFWLLVETNARVVGHIANENWEYFETRNATIICSESTTIIRYDWYGNKTTITFDENMFTPSRTRNEIDRQLFLESIAWDFSVLDSIATIAEYDMCGNKIINVLAEDAHSLDSFFHELSRTGIMPFNQVQVWNGIFRAIGADNPNMGAIVGERNFRPPPEGSLGRTWFEVFLVGGLPPGSFTNMFFSNAHGDDTGIARGVTMSERYQLRFPNEAYFVRVVTGCTTRDLHIILGFHAI